MKKMPAPSSVSLVAEGQRLLHLQLREADVDAVDERDDVADDQQRQQVPADLGEQRLVLGAVILVGVPLRVGWVHEVVSVVVWNGITARRLG